MTYATPLTRVSEREQDRCQPRGRGDRIGQVQPGHSIERGRDRRRYDYGHGSRPMITVGVGTAMITVGAVPVPLPRRRVVADQRPFTTTLPSPCLGPQSGYTKGADLRRWQLSQVSRCRLRRFEPVQRSTVPIAAPVLLAPGLAPGPPRVSSLRRPGAAAAARRYWRIGRGEGVLRTSSAPCLTVARTQVR